MRVATPYAIAVTRPTVARPMVALVMLLALPGCLGLRTRHPATAPEPPAAPTTAEMPPQELQTADVHSESPAQSRPADAAAPPACTCTDAKTKLKPRPRPVHKEAPAPLPTAPLVAKNPPAATVDAEVRPMPVSVMSILGKRVRGAKGEDLGRVVDVLADAGGRVRIAIIDFGGFLGVGNHRIAVEWRLLRFSPDATDPSLVLNLSPEKLRTAPEYRDNPRPQTLMDPAIAPVETQK